MKKITLLLCCFILIFALTGCGETSSDDFETKDYYGSGVVVTKYLGSKDSVVIPSIINGEKVVAIGRGFCSNSDLKKVVIPDTITDIEQDAFYECSSLEKVTLPDGLEWIHFYTFQNCIALKQIEIPESVTRIDMGSFAGCDNLNMIVHKGSCGESYAKSYSEMYGFTYTVK